MRVPLFRERPSFRPGRRASRRVLVILAPTDADVRSTKRLRRRLRPLGVDLVAASECHGEIDGEHGAILHPNELLVEAAREPWDAVVVGGGAGARRVAEDLFARELVRRVATDGKPVAALGGGRALLERAGVDGFASDSGDALARWLGERLGVAHSVEG